nr:LOW QUALITY PROTEIN: crooked neck-like protein 1 [Aegilops tauschii subsp. strangulata]
MALTTRRGGGADQPSLGFLTNRDTEVRLPRATRVKNKAPAGVQITAEQILREARELQEPEIRPPRQRITDADELADYRLGERKRFEGLVTRGGVAAWVKYARWEEGQGDLARARSVYERALDLDAARRDHALWLKYAEFEMRSRCVNHARNVWDRAVSLLPRVDQLWHNYIHMEELLGAVANARWLFERWMGWRPDIAAWNSYIKFELRYGEVERARAIYQRLVAEHPRPDTFIRYAKFEMEHGGTEQARRVYERASELLVDDEDAELLFVAFAEFEENRPEVERVRAIYKYALDRVPKGKADDLYRKFLAFEKRFGDREGIEDAVVSKQRFQYEDEVRKNPLNYDSWFDYIRLEESAGNKDRIRDVYERAIANVPPAQEKRYWQRYIYLWINYALYEELDAQDMERTREVYRAYLKLIPHKKFTFAKLWLMAAQFEIRQKNIKAARRILGNAIGMTPKGKLFKEYIEIELHIGNFDRCRTLYEKYIEWSPANCYAWRKYAELEKNLSEADRARSVYELGITQPSLDTPEVLWKEYLQFEIDEGEFGRARELYERLLDRTKHLKVWISYAEFEASAGLAEDNGSEVNKNDACYQDQQIERVRMCRAVFERAFDYFRTNAAELKEERAMLLEEWLKKELGFGDLGDVALVQKKAPRKVKRKRPLPTDDGSNVAYEEYVDYIFPDEVTPASNLKISAAAYKWKKQKAF